MAGSNGPLPMDTALKTVSDASVHVTKSEQNLTGKVHNATDSTSSSSLKNSTAENLSGELHVTTSMNNVRSGTAGVFDESVSTTKTAGGSGSPQARVVTSNSNLIGSALNQTSSQQAGLLVNRGQTDDVAVGGVANGPGSVPAKARKSSFQITRVTGSTPGSTIAGDHASTTGGQVGSLLDTMEDTDEMTPNTGSEGHDISRSTADLSEDTETSADTLRSPTSETDGDAFLASAGAVFDQILPRIVVPATAAAPAAPTVLLAMAVTSSTTNGKSSPVADIQSRFKIVKILNRVRGRWKCLDFAGPPMSAAESAGGSKSESPSAVAGMTVQLQRIDDAGSADTLIDVSHLVSSVPSTLDSGVGMSLQSQNFYRTANTTLSQLGGTTRSSSDPAFVTAGGVVINGPGMEANCDPNNQMLLNLTHGAESIDDNNERYLSYLASLINSKLQYHICMYHFFVRV